MRSTLLRIACAGFFVLNCYAPYASAQDVDVVPTPAEPDASMFNVIFAPPPTAAQENQNVMQNQPVVSQTPMEQTMEQPSLNFARGGVVPAAVNIMELKGQALVIDPTQNSVNTLISGDKIPENTIIVTGPDSTAKIAFSNGSSLYLSAQTVVWLKRYFCDFNQKMPLSQVELNLYRGCIMGHKEQLLTGSTYSIYTPLGTANIQGQSYLFDMGQLSDLDFKKSKLDLVADTLSQTDSTTYNRTNKAVLAMQTGNADFKKSGQDAVMIVPEANMIEISSMGLPRLFSITPEINERLLGLTGVAVQKTQSAEGFGMASQLGKGVNEKLIDTRKIPQDIMSRNLLCDDPNVAISNLDIGLGASDMSNTQLNPQVFTLVDRDPSAMYELKAGHVAVIIDLGDFKDITSIYFQSFGAIGSVDIAFASTLQGPSGGQWQLSESNANFGPSVNTSVQFGQHLGAGTTALRMKSLTGSGFTPVATDTGFSPLEQLRLSVTSNQTRYVLLVFRVTKAGPIGSFGIQVDEHAQPSIDSLSTTGLITGAETLKIAGVSSGAANTVGYMTDDDYRTEYKFSPDDPAPVVLVDLKEQTKIQRASLLLEAGIQGTLEFYVLNENELPEGARLN